MDAATLSDRKRELLQRILRGDAAIGASAEDLDRGLTRSGRSVAPLSVEQTRVWLHAAMTPEPIYNETFTLHRDGTLDVGALEASFNAVLARHEAWRTVFEERGGEVVQVVQPASHVALAVTDLTGLPEAEREAAALRLATEAARAPFDLTRGPLFRPLLVRLAPERHRLYLALHHLIFDAISINHVLLPELIAGYEAVLAGNAPELPPPPLQYVDYACQRNNDTIAPAPAHLAYWREQLGGELPVLELAADRPRPPVIGHHGEMAVFNLPRSLAEALRQLAARHGATLHMVLLAAFAVLLFRRSGQEDFCIGAVTHTRRTPDLARVMGYFLNSLVLRTRPRREMRFCDYLGQIRETELRALDASDVPFDRLLEMLRPARDPSRHPLFQVMFSMQPAVPPVSPGWDLTQMDVPTGWVKFDLHLEVEERPDGIAGRFLYSSALFDRATIDRMTGHYRQLLQSILADPEATLGRLDLLTPAERSELRSWNHLPRHAALGFATVPEWFAHRARLHPASPALHHGATTWSYAELAARVAAIADALRAAGVRRGMLVGVRVERSADMVAALLGVLAAGGAYLPLDPGWPAARLRLVLDEAGVELLLVRAAEDPAVADCGVALLGLDRLPDPLGELVPPSMAGEPPLGTDLAYVLYTSGSTGRPKGVEITHGSLVNLLASMQRAPGFGPQDKILAVTPYSFDISILEMFLPLVSGGQVVIAAREVAADPFRLADMIADSGCTVMQATPATWRGLLAAGWPGRPGLRIWCGGEAMTPDLAAALLDRGAVLWNMYGPTETTIWSAIHPVREASAPIPIGLPIDATTLHVLDAEGGPVPVGVPGELHIGGAGLARGYRHRPDLTAERFVTSPAVPGERLYRTGDLVRRRPDGLITFCGRFDDEVKIRGLRIALGEIESVLARHPEVAAAAVKAWPDASGELSLAAYIVRTAGADHRQDAGLRAHLREQLPDYMVPAHFVTLTALPLTPHGKVDRKALPVPASSERVAILPPSGATEARLAELWRALLRTGPISRDDDFFALGGHSLLAAQLLIRIEATFGVRPSLASLFRASTLAGMAALLPAPVDEGSRAGFDGAEADRSLMLCFESLGDDCEFGLLQRRCGAEPLGLFRFTGITPAMLLRALEARCAGMEDEAQLTVQFDPATGEGSVRHALYDCEHLIVVRERAASIAEVRASESRKLAFMRRKLIEDLEDGEKICVIKSRDGIAPEEIAALQAQLGRYGAAPLLWVSLADADHAPGDVEWAGPRLLRGWIDRFAPPEAIHDASPMWLVICRRAIALWKAAPEQDGVG